MAAVAADIGKGIKRAVLSSDEQHGGVAHLVCALHARLGNLIAAPDALPAAEELLLLPGKDLIGGVRRDGQHAAFAKGSQRARELIGRQGGRREGGGHGGILGLPSHRDPATHASTRSTEERSHAAIDCAIDCTRI